MGPAVPGAESLLVPLGAGAAGDPDAGYHRGRRRPPDRRTRRPDRQSAGGGAARDRARGDGQGLGAAPVRPPTAGPRHKISKTTPCTVSLSYYLYLLLVLPRRLVRPAFGRWLCNIVIKLCNASDGGRAAL